MHVLTALKASPSDAAAVDSFTPKAVEVETSSHDDDNEVTRSLGRRRRKSERPQDLISECRDCGKTFKRPCDLTKHEKSHSRPWKCSEENCKYHDLGWPTEKERDRHVADKHSSEPVQFKCQYPPCTYASKRESNCKQHMEKAHGYQYVRSKSNGKRKGCHNDDTLPPSASLSSSYPSSANITPSFSDISSVTICAENFNVKLDDNWQFDVKLDDNWQLVEGFADGDSPSPIIYEDFTLWTSNPIDYSLFDPAITIDSKDTETTTSSSKELQHSKSSRLEPATQIDPQLSTDSDLESSKECRKVPLQAEPAARLESSSSEQPAEVERIIPDTPRPSPISDQLDTLPKAAKRALDVDTKKDETRPPPKKVKKCTPKRDKLRLMSCIYRKHKPDTYNYKDSKFKTCHTTSHEYISTLVRHLERYHNAVLCHTCLSAFDNAKEKDKHKNKEKCKAAYGCQEDKWQTLYKTLCGDGIHHSPDFECALEHSPRTASMETQQSSQGSPPEDKADSPMSQSSTQTAAFVSSGPSAVPSTPVSLNNAEREELERLREENNQLLRENNALLRRVLQWESVCASMDMSTLSIPVAT
ncbi:hypothetical protein BCR34DRAFT_567821 [Clohesyomyces aquaticus]|uniref:C2H2-type domain-containing protein n=1 Tax=Clohesyomyces aquaticus TaxID=1231657 RepID=A0A1Y1ZHY5_9PLEO|nr:hypothetical protein BCR34DRAFT_567821 [Clohesyomyces aquaticus]